MTSTTKAELMTYIEVNDHVKTIFNPQHAFKVLRHEKIGAGYQIAIETVIAGQRSEQLVRGNEITALIKAETGEVMTCQPRGPLYRTLQEIHEKSGADPDTVIIEDSGKAAVKEHVVTAPRTPPTHRPIPERKPSASAASDVAAESSVTNKPKAAASGLDFVAALLTKTPYRDVAQTLGFDVVALDAKYEHLDTAKQRMCFGNLIRARYRKDPVAFEAQFPA